MLIKIQKGNYISSEIFYTSFFLGYILYYIKFKHSTDIKYKIIFGRLKLQYLSHIYN